MKFMFIAFAILVSASAGAQEYRTSDDVNYLVTLQDGASLKACVSQLRKIARAQGDGKVHLIAPEMGIVLIHVTSYGAEQARQLQCVLAVEAEEEAEALPRIGRGN